MKQTYTDEELNHRFHELHPEIKGSLTGDQLQIIRTILSGRDSVSILATASGKSACFQVAASILRFLRYNNTASLASDSYKTARSFA